MMDSHFSTHLTATVPQARADFQRDLEARLRAAFDQRIDQQASRPVARPAATRSAQRQSAWFRRSLTLAAAAVLAVALLAGAPLAQHGWAVHRLVQSAAAAPPTTPPGQVLQCTTTLTVIRDGRPEEARVVQRVWLDPQRQLARVDALHWAGPSAGQMVRTVGDAQSLVTYRPQEGLKTWPESDYRALERPCSLADGLAQARQQLADDRLGRSIVLSEETLEGVPVVVLSFRGDQLPRLTFTRDEHRLIRIEQPRRATDGQPVAGEIEDIRITHTFVPADQYPDSFFSIEAITQP